MPSREQIAACKWMTEEELRVYSIEFIRTGFQGGLNYYRARENSRYTAELRAFTDRTIDVRTLFLGGDSEWGPYQSPGALEAMQNEACTRFVGAHFVRRSGHSLAEEQPAEINRLLVNFLRA